MKHVPALFSPGPKRRGICLITASEARKAWYFFDIFLTNFLFLLNFFRSSTLIEDKEILEAYMHRECMLQMLTMETTNATW